MLYLTRLIFITVVLASTFAQAETSGRVIAKCSSTGTVSIESYLIRFNRNSFSEGPTTTKPSIFVIEQYQGSKLMQSLTIPAQDTKASYNEENGALLSLTSLSRKNQVDIEISGRGSRMEIRSAKMNVSSTNLNCIAQ